LSAIDFDRWFTALYDRFGRCEAWKTFDDVTITIDALRSRGLKLGLISNWDSRLRNILRGLGLLDALEVVKISSEAGARKPDPLMFRQAQAELGIDSSQALHVGDLLSEDIAGARQSGWQAVLIDRTRTLRADGDGYRVIHQLTELIHAV
jgi:putative hydrolase of the HAD superfamily